MTNSLTVDDSSTIGTGPAGPGSPDDLKKGPSLRRVATASLVGTTIEFYDFFIYGTAAALVFPTVFFPNMTPMLSTVASFATFGVAFLARPLGSVVFGHFGDILGRKRTLVWTLLMMGIATLFIGLLPGYETGVFGFFESGIGVWGPVLLVAMRFLQGMAVGGEWAGATLLTAEYAPPGKRGAYAMFPQLGAAIAFFLSSGTFVVVFLAIGETSNAFLEWAWRIPFLLSILMVFVGLYVRLAIQETPSFQKEQKRRAEDKANGVRRTLPFMDTIRYQWREAMTGGIALASLFSLFYMGTSYLTSYGTAKLGLERIQILAVGMGAAIIFGSAIAASAAISDRIGRTNVIVTSTVLAVLWTPALFWVLDFGTIWHFALGLTVTMVIFGISYGPAGAMLPEMFRVDLRYTGAGLAYNIAAILGGAIPPLIAAPLADAYGGLAVGLFLAAISLTSCIAVTRIRSNHEDDIDEHNQLVRESDALAKP